MAFMRTDTPKSMMSRAWSTNDLGAALEHIVLNKDELPDDLSQLEVRVFQSSEDSIVFRNIKPVGSRPVHSFFSICPPDLFSRGVPPQELEKALADMGAIESSVWGLAG